MGGLAETLSWPLRAEVRGRAFYGIAVTVRRRMRYWTDGAVIGSETFVREVAARLFDAKRALRKRLARGTQADSSDPLFAYRRLDSTL